LPAKAALGTTPASRPSSPASRLLHRQNSTPLPRRSGLASESGPGYNARLKALFAGKPAPTQAEQHPAPRRSGLASESALGTTPVSRPSSPASRLLHRQNSTPLPRRSWLASESGPGYNARLKALFAGNVITNADKPGL